MILGPSGSGKVGYASIQVLDPTVSSIARVLMRLTSFVRMIDSFVNTLLKFSPLLEFLRTGAGRESSPAPNAEQSGG